MLPALLLPAISSIAPHISFTSSPRYEGDPLIGSVQGRLQQLTSGDASAIAQTHADAVSGAPAWKDVARVLAPAVRPDLFGSPARALTDQERQITGVAPGNPAEPAAAGTSGAPSTVGTQIATFFGFGPSQQEAAAAAAGSAAGSQLSRGIVKVAVILGVVIIGVVLLRRFLK